MVEIGYNPAMIGLSEAILHNTSGVRITLRDANVCRVLQSFVDFFVLDPVASALSDEMLQSMLLVANEKPVLVRAEDHSPSTLQKYLNWGVDGLIIPNIRTEVEAENAIAACLYPPEGVRPYRPLHKLDEVDLGVVNDQVTLIIEVAHQSTVAQIESIAEITGLDGLLVMPKALSVAMELNGRLDHPELLAALGTILKTAESFDLPCGFEDVVSDKLRANFHVLTSDVALLQKAAKQVLGEPDTEENNGLHALR